MARVFCSFGLVLLLGAVAGAEVTVCVNPGPFDSVEQAAAGEGQVDFWDADLADDRACSECFAAVELKHFLVRVTEYESRDIELRRADRMPARGPVFLLGSTASNPLIAKVSEGKDVDLATDESFSIRTVRADGRTVTIIQGADRVGTLYGVYEYLNRLGVRFFGLGEAGTVYPVGSVKLPAELNVTENPAYLTRGFWITADPKPDPNDMHLWMVRNKINLWTALDHQVPKLKKLGLKLTVGGHENQLFYLHPRHEYPYNCAQFTGDESKPTDPYRPSDDYQGDKNNDGKLSYFEVHPEWYGLIDGKRSDKFAWNGHNFCTSNIDAAREFGKNMAEGLATGRWKHADIVNFWMFDCHGGWCHCDRCQAQGSITDRFFILVDIVFQEIAKVRAEGRLSRDVLISPLAYEDTIFPPTKPLPEGFNYDDCLLTFFPIGRCYAHTLADTSCSEVNQRLYHSYVNWVVDSGRHYKGGVFIGEYYNVSSLMSLPTVYTRIMSSDVPWYFENGARHFCYMHSPIVRWGTWTLNQYLLSRLLWDIDLDSDRVIDEYYRRYYPTTHATTKQVYQRLERATANLKAFKHFITLKNESRFYLTQSWAQHLTSKNKPIFWVDHLHYEPQASATNETLSIVEMVDEMAQARAALDKSLLACQDESERTRLLADNARLDYGRTMYQFLYHLVRTSMFFHQDDEVLARAEFDKARIYADLLRQITDMANVTGGGGPANALDATQAVAAYEFFEKRYGSE